MFTTQGGALTTKGGAVTTKGGALTTQGGALTTQGSVLTTHGDKSLIGCHLKEYLTKLIISIDNVPVYVNSRLIQ